MGTRAGHQTCALGHVLLGEWKTWSGWWWGGCSSQALSASQARSFTELSGQVKTELRDSPGTPPVKTPPLHAGAVASVPDRGAKIPHSSRPRKPKPPKLKQYYINSKFNKNFKNGPHQKAESLKNALVTFCEKVELKTQIPPGMTAPACALLSNQSREMKARSTVLY